MELHHVKLTGVRYGCMYASLYALIGDDGLLVPELMRDVSSVRHQLQALKRGWMVHSLYIHPTETCSREVWEWLYERRPRGENSYIPLLVSIPSPSYEGERHMVAMVLDWEGVFWVSDCNKDEIVKHDDILGFLSSNYAHAFEIEQLAPAQLDYHGFEDAEAALQEAGL